MLEKFLIVGTIYGTLYYKIISDKKVNKQEFEWHLLNVHKFLLLMYRYVIKQQKSV